MSKSNMEEKHTQGAEQLRRLTAELNHRRDSIAEIQRAKSVLIGAYDLVVADLRATSVRES
jgi:hypothetical protein